MGEVVDVLGGTGEVDELGNGLQFLVAGKTLLDKVFHRFHIVIGGGFNILDPPGIHLGEARDNALKQFVGRR